MRDHKKPDERRGFVLVLDFTKPPEPERDDRLYPWSEFEHAYLQLPVEERRER